MPEDYPSMAGHYRKKVTGDDSGRSKLSDYSANSAENLITIHTYRGILLGSGAFAEEDRLSEEPTMINAATEGGLRDNVSPRGSCGSSPEKIRDAVESFKAVYIDSEHDVEAQSGAQTGVGVETKESTSDEGGASPGLQERFQHAGGQSSPANSLEAVWCSDTVYVDPECRVDTRSLARAEVMREGERSTSSKKEVIHVLQDRFLPAAEAMAAKIATETAPGQNGQKLPLQELSTNTLLSPRFQGILTLHDSAEKMDSGGISDKENSEPRKPRYGAAAVRDSKKGGKRVAASARKDVRPPGFSQVEWVRRVYGWRV